MLLVNQFHDILPGSSITEVNERARADLAGVEATADGLAAAAWRARRDGGGEAPVNTIPWRRDEVVATRPAPSCSSRRRRAGRAVVAPDAARARRADARTAAPCSRTRTCARCYAGRRDRLARPPRDRPRGAGRPRQPPRALRGPPDRLGRLGRRPVPPRDPRRLRAGRRDRRLAARPLRAEVASSARSAPARTCARPSASTPARGASRSTRSPTGTRTTACSRSPSRSPCTPTRRRTRPRSASSAARRTTRPATTSPATRSPATASRTSPSTASASRCSPTASMAGARTATRCASPCCARPAPDPEADMGDHDFAYAILPHAGGWQDAGVVGEARAFNAPLRWGAGRRRRHLARSTTRPASCSTRSSAPRTATRSSSASTRPTAAAAARASASASRSRRAAFEPARGRPRAGPGRRRRDRRPLPPVGDRDAARRLALGPGLGPTFFLCCVPPSGAGAARTAPSGGRGEDGSGAGVGVAFHWGPRPPRIEEEPFAPDI